MRYEVSLLFSLVSTDDFFRDEWVADLYNVFKLLERLRPSGAPFRRPEIHFTKLL